MPTPQEEQLNVNIDLLFAIQFEGMDAPARQNLMEAMDDIRQEYRLAAEKGSTSKYHKDVSEAIAKSVPALVKGAYPCADGTLIVCMQDEIYTAHNEIKRGLQRIVTSSWVKHGGNAKQVIKMSIPCWSVLESLKATLQAE